MTTPPWYQYACAEASIDHAKSNLAKTDANDSGRLKKRSVFVRSDRMWENGTTLEYGFVDKTDTPALLIKKSKVHRTINEWSKYANIAFHFQQEGTPKIRIAFDSQGGSWSFVGKDNIDIDVSKPTMNLGWLDGSSDTITDNERGVILHEFGHAIGLLHEHQSPLRSDKITLKEGAVIDFYTTGQGWTKQEVEEQIIRVYNKSEISNFSEVDLTSIMMYFMPPEMNNEEIRIKPNNQLSDTDKAFVAINYPIFTTDSNNVSSESSIQKFEDALDIAGVAGNTRKDILNYFAKGDWKEIRCAFIDWCSSTRFARKAAQGAKPKDSGELPEGFTRGCLTESLNDELKPGISGPGAARGVATEFDNLWTPGQTVTYTFLQGSKYATPYRMKRVKETMAAYAARANLSLQRVPWDPSVPAAHIRIWFGDIPKKGVLGWSYVGKNSVGAARTQGFIDTRGGSVDSSICFSLEAIPGDKTPSDSDAKELESEVLYHEIGHALGLEHEHESPNTITTDTPTKDASIATAFDQKSVMLYPGLELRQSASAWQKLKHFFAGVNSVPSNMDYAFLSAIYPFPSGHQNDKLKTDLKTLALSKNHSESLIRLRDDAFKVQGLDEFDARIKTYRDMLKKFMKALTAPKAARPANMLVPPSHFNSLRDAQVKPPAEATTGPFLDVLMKTLSAFFKPTTGQIFALQFPGRFLQKDLYAWDTKKAGIYGQFVKPTVVNESEFRLVDQLYNVGPIVGAPSGINLSIVYEQCLNNLIPGVPSSAIDFQKQQSKIREWLLKDVKTTGWIKELIKAQHNIGIGTDKTSSKTPTVAPPGIKASSAINPDSKPQFALADKLADDNKINRMELSQALMQEYLAAKQAWELERDDMIKNAKGEDLDALTRRLAHITAIRESQLASKYADAVVRGYSHVIRQYLGYMDIKSPAETLQDAKDALRESAMSSLDGSMKIYPIQMTPVDWFQSLSTSFNMEDLTSKQDVIEQQLSIKSKLVEDLNLRLALIQSNPKQSVKELQQKFDFAQEAYDNASADLSTRYTSNVISLAKTFINKSNVFAIDDFKKAAGVANIADAAISNIEDGINKLTQTQLTVTQTSRALTTLMAAKSLAESSDTAQEVVELQVQITALQKDIAELTTRLQSLRYASPPPPAKKDKDGNELPPSVNDIDLYPPESSSGGSRWQEMYIKHTVNSTYSASSNQSSASAQKNDVSLFFGSYHSESKASQAGSESTSSSSSVDVEVGFRATMVTVDRGGWFQPQFFKQSAGFHHIDPKITWSKWPENITTFQQLVDSQDKSVFDTLNKGLLPAYPTGFIICKDITIRILMTGSDIQTAGKEMEKYAESSAGVLCWSTSSSDRSTSSEKSSSFVQKSDGCVIRIPGPQILGYMLQITDNDETTVVPDKLPDGFLLSDADYDLAFADKTAGHSVNPTTANPTPTNPTTNPVSKN